MDDADAPVIELRLLTYRLEQMEKWWATLLDGTPQPLGSRFTVITGGRLRLVIERSQIAYDYYPEASGVTAIMLTFIDVCMGRRILNKLAALGSQPHRATRDGGVISLWLRDPNGTDVAMRISARSMSQSGTGIEELDVDAALADIATLSLLDQPPAGGGRETTRAVAGQTQLTVAANREARTSACILGQ